MNPQIAQEIQLLQDFLGQHDELGIVIGSHQNLDTVASALALYLTLTQSGKKVQVISKKEPTVEVAGLVGIDRIKSGFTGNTTKLVVSLPYKKGEVEKVLFTEAPNTINFHLTAANGQSITPFDNNDVKLIWEGGAPEAIITIGVSTIDELEGAIDTNTAKIVNIDNYQGNSKFGDVILVDESLSSLSEIIGKIIKDLNLPSDIDIAQNILDGILFATRNFTKNNTSPLAFEAASTAMYQGAQRKVEERAQNFAGQNKPISQGQQDRGRGEQRQQNQNRGQQQQGISENDFPAMHMQNQPRVSQNQNQPGENRRTNNPQRTMQSQGAPRVNQQFGRGQNVTDVRNKIVEESQRSAVQNQPQEEIAEMQTVNQPQINTQIQDVKTPEEQVFNAPSNEEIPDDWLMPKVFKSSKNNN